MVSRLVTLSGPGGVGKTRLALRVAADVRRVYRDGVWLVELDQLHDEALVPQAVATSMGLRDQPGRALTAVLVEHLAGRDALLVLDNCEHLLEAVARLAGTVVPGCDGVRILVTSREPLALGGEFVLPVPPLPVPDPGAAVSLAQSVAYPAVELFVQRATAAVPGFAVSEANQAAVTDICRRTDGLPLAIELCVGWLRVLSLSQLRERLDDRLGMLNRGARGRPGRLQTVRGCVGWSFDLCTAAERRLWAQLSVFAGGFDMDAVEGICADGWSAAEVGQLVTSLVDKSILAADHGGGAERYRMLEVIRQFGRERLREAGDERVLLRRHRDWYASLVCQAEAEWISPRQVEWFGRLDREMPNVRAALEFSLDQVGADDAAVAAAEPETHARGGAGDAEVAARVAAALYLYWVVRGLISEGRHWLGAALAGERPAGRTRVRALFTDALLACLQGDVPTAVARVDEGRAVAAGLADPHSVAVMRTAEAVLGIARNDLHQSVADFAAAADTFERFGDLFWWVTALSGMSTPAAMLGDTGTAARAHGQVLALCEPRGAPYHCGYTALTLAIASWTGHRIHQAQRSLARALRLMRGMRESYTTASCLEVLAWIAASGRQGQRAATLLGAAAALSQAMGSPAAVWPDLQPHHQQCVRSAQGQLGEEAFAAAFSRGTALGIDDAIGFALAEPATPAPAGGRHARPGQLSEREWQVCRLVGQGLTNRQVATRLGVSTRTVESHVGNALAKLGFTSRAQIVAWMTTQLGPPEPPAGD